MGVAKIQMCDFQALLFQAMNVSRSIKILQLSSFLLLRPCLLELIILIYQRCNVFFSQQNNIN